MRLADPRNATRALTRCSGGTWRRRALLAVTILILHAASSAALAQTGPLQPGEAVVTRFSGTATVPIAGGQATVINPDGASASIIDVRSPRRPPSGDHWINEPQRRPVTAREVGQVFGVALDTEAAPSIYLSATSAFGLHRTPDNSNWMQAMWGAGGNPGTIYKLDAQTGYQARPFANITLNGRPNSGAALGNIAYDRWNQQLFVSDLETGMIHRIRAGDGADLGFYDHGVQGRNSFLDAENRQQRSLPPIPFNPLAGEDQRLPVGAVPVFAGVLEFRAQRPASLGPGRRAGGVRRRNPAVLFGCQRPGSGRSDLEPPRGRREA